MFSIVNSSTNNVYLNNVFSTGTGLVFITVQNDNIAFKEDVILIHRIKGTHDYFWIGIETDYTDRCDTKTF